MNYAMINRFDTDDKKDTTKPVSSPPISDKTPVSPTEGLVREELRKLTENDEEIQMIKDQLERKNKVQD